jgi:hypothetical protein
MLTRRFTMPRRAPLRLFSFTLLATLAATTLIGAQPPLQPPEILVDPPAPSVLPLPQSVIPAPTLVDRPLTVQEFARMVDPRPGHYDVLFCHPYTGEAVRVCFDLPSGCPRVCVEKRLLFHVLVFDYGRCEVEIKFGCKGRVRVHD